MGVAQAASLAAATAAAKSEAQEALAAAAAAKAALEATAAAAEAAAMLDNVRLDNVPLSPQALDPNAVMSGFSELAEKMAELAGQLQTSKRKAGSRERSAEDEGFDLDFDAYSTAAVEAVGCDGDVAEVGSCESFANRDVEKTSTLVVKSKSRESRLWEEEGMGSSSSSPTEALMPRATSCGLSVEEKEAIAAAVKP